MKIKCLFLIAILLAVTLIGFAQSKNQTSGIRKINFLNYSYQPSACSDIFSNAKTVKLSKGKFKSGDNTYYINKGDVVYGDVNGDGIEDAVVLTRCSTGTSFRGFDLHVFTFQNGKEKLLAQLDSQTVYDDYEKTFPDSVFCCAGNAPKLQNGHLIIQALTDGLLLNPENATTFDYQLSGDKFVLSGTPKKQKNTAK
jgi:hypothetical protein